MNTSLALITPAEYELMAKLAQVAANSGYANKNTAQALFVMLKGYELGLSPFAALDGIQVIQQKPTVSPQLMLAMINRSGDLEDMIIDSNPTICTVTMKRKGRTAHTETFSMEDAKRMKLAEKSNWLQQPATMLKWRAVGACARIVFPDILMGVYTPEEMGADVTIDDAGDLVIPQLPIAQPAPQLPETVVIEGQTVDTATGVIIEEQPPEPQLPPAAEIFGQNEQKRIPTPGYSKTYEGELTKIVDIQAMENDGKRYKFLTKGGRHVSCFGSDLFKSANIDTSDWKAQWKLNPPIPVRIEEKRDKDNRVYYNVTAVLSDTKGQAA